VSDKRILAALLLFVGGFFVFRSFHDALKSHASTRAAAASKPQNRHSDAVPMPGTSSVETPLVHASFRPLHFALLRGGFSSVNEFFERVHDDPVLHTFYGDCTDRNASMHALPEDITAFSTFREGDKIDARLKLASKMDVATVQNFGHVESPDRNIAGMAHAVPLLTSKSTLPDLFPQ
jgi:hypothetical protein